MLELSLVHLTVSMSNLSVNNVVFNQSFNLIFINIFSYTAFQKGSLKSGTPSTKVDIALLYKMNKISACGQ